MKVEQVCKTHHICDCLSSERNRMIDEIKSLRADVIWKDARIGNLKDDYLELEEKFRNVCRVAYGEIPEDLGEAPDNGKD